MASKRGGIDYSKWDKMDYDSSSSSDGSDGDGGGAHPRVTRLDGPGRVTRGADGMITVSASGFGGEAAVQATDEDAKAGAAPPPACAGAAAPEKPHARRKDRQSPVDELSENGGSFVDPRTSSDVLWRQDRQEVVVSVRFDLGERMLSRDVAVRSTGAVPYEERSTAVVGGAIDEGGGRCGTLRITAGAETLLEGELPHRVHLAEDEDEVEWEVVPFPTAGAGKDGTKHGSTELSLTTARLVRVTLRKAVPMAGATIWWDCPLRHCPRIDVSSIKGRREQGAVGNAWDEAHRLFKAKVQSGELRQALPLDIDRV